MNPAMSMAVTGLGRQPTSPAMCRAGPVGSPTRPLTGLQAVGLQAVIDALDIGVLVSDERGRLLLANAAARRELAEGGVLQLSADGALEVFGGAGLLLLRRAVHAAALARAYQLVPLRRGERQLMVSVQPLRSGDGAPPCALLLLGRRRLCPALAVQELGRLYDLTAAESSVLASLLAGLPVGAMARARGVAVSTVRSQVAALRAKFGVRRIDDITRLVAELPPMLGALPGLGAALGGGAGGAAGLSVLHR
jgi:DNA-binding CsgD family transcriptional regulator